MPRIVHEALDGPSRPLPRSIQSYMTSRLGHDFGNVQVHTDARADEATRAVDAAAYTVGNHVVLRQGHHTPFVIAHELAHVVQHQSSGPVTDNLSLGGLDDPLERQAESAATTLARGGHARVHGRSSEMVVRRAPVPTGIQLAEAKPFGHADLKDDALKQKFRTYIGSTTRMSVTPTDDYKGTCTKEYLTEVSNTCPARFAELRKEAFCTESKCLEFDRWGTAGDPETGKTVTDTKDSFIDRHRTRHTESLLEGTGKKECSVVCHQLYKFERKNELGAFYVIRNFKEGAYTPTGSKTPIHITTGDIQKVAAPLVAPSAADFAKKDAADLKKKGVLTDPPPVPKAPPPVPKEEKK